MKLKLQKFAVHDPLFDGQKTFIRAGLSIVFANPDVPIGGGIDVDIEHESPRSLTFNDVESLAIEFALAQL